MQDHDGGWNDSGDVIPDLQQPYGHRFGKLVTQSVIWSANAKQAVGLLCKCDCGRYVKVTIQSLRMGKQFPTECDECKLSLKAAQTIVKKRKSSPRIFVWKCKSDEYPYHYRVWKRIRREESACKRWHDSFDQFVYDIGMPPTKYHILRRKNTKKKYGPNNWYWYSPSRGTTRSIWFKHAWHDLHVLKRTYDIDPVWYANAYARGYRVGETMISLYFERRPFPLSAKQIPQTVWTDVPNTDQRYQVSNSGLVKAGHRTINPRPDGNGGWVYELLFNATPEQPTGTKKLKIEELMKLCYPNGAPPMFLEEKPVSFPTENPPVVPPETVEPVADPSQPVEGLVEAPVEVVSEVASEPEEAVSEAGVSQPAEPTQSEVVPTGKVEAVPEPEQAPAEVPVEAPQIASEAPTIAETVVESPVVVEAPVEAPTAPEAVVEVPTAEEVHSATVDILTAAVDSAIDTVAEQSVAAIEPVAKVVEPARDPQTGALNVEPAEAAVVTPEPPAEAAAPVPVVDEPVAPAAPVEEKKELTPEESAALVKAELAAGKTAEELATQFGVTVEVINQLAGV